MKQPEPEKGNTVNKALRIIGIIAIAVVIYWFGYTVGQAPTATQVSQANYVKQYIADMRTIGQDYSTIANLCETKYQAAVQGNISGAYTIKGQMDGVNAQIQQILSKYNTQQQ